MTITTSIRRKSSPESEEMITSFVTSHSQGALTSTAKDGTLQSSVVNVFETGDSQFSFMTKKDTRKSANIHNNPIVSFITYDPVSRTEVEIEGVAMLVVDPGEVREVLKKIRSDSDLGRPHISPYVNEFDDYVLYTIYPRNIYMTTFWELEKTIEVFREFIEFDMKMSS